MRKNVKSKMRKKNLINFFILFSLMIILFTGCSDGKSDELQKQVDELTTQYEELQEKYDNLDEEHKNLQTNYETLQYELEEHEDQQATIDDLNAKVIELQGQYDALQADRDNLQQQLDAKKLAEEQAARTAQQQPVVTAQQSEGTVYWTPNGECYHSTANCSTLKRSSNISSGTVSQSGRRPCNVCH